MNFVKLNWVDKNEKKNRFILICADFKLHRLCLLATLNAALHIAHR